MRRAAIAIIGAAGIGAAAAGCGSPASHMQGHTPRAASIPPGQPGAQTLSSVCTVIQPEFKTLAPGWTLKLTNNTSGTVEVGAINVVFYDSSRGEISILGPVSLSDQFITAGQSITVSHDDAPPGSATCKLISWNV
jgi:hypothetical protein